MNELGVSACGRCADDVLTVRGVAAGWGHGRGVGPCSCIQTKLADDGTDCR